MSPSRLEASFTAAVAKKIGPKVLDLLRAYAENGEEFQTQDIAAALELEPGSKEREFVIHFLRRLDKSRVIEATDQKKRYKNWRVRSPHSLGVQLDPTNGPLRTIRQAVTGHVDPQGAHEDELWMRLNFLEKQVLQLRQDVRELQQKNLQHGNGVDELIPR